MAGLADLDRQRWLWLAYGVVLAIVLGFVLWSFVGTFVFALFIYYAVRPFHRRIRRHVRQRTVAATLSLLTLAVPVVVLIAYTTAIALQELGRFSATADLGPLADILDPYIDLSAIVDNPATLLEEASLESITEVFDQTLNYLGLVGGTLIQAFLMFAVAFYLLRDGHRIKRLVTAASDDDGLLDSYLTAVDRSLSKIFFGNLLNAVMTAAIGAIAFSLLNGIAPPGLTIPYPALMGVLAGVASLIPIVGMKLVWVPLAGYLAFRAYVLGSGWAFVGIFTVISIVVVDAIPDFALRPYVSGRSLHVGSVMIAYIVGPLLFGWYGIFLGPMLLVVLIQFVRIVLPELLDRSDVEPAGVDPGAVSGEDRKAAGISPETPADGADTPTTPPTGTQTDAGED